MINPISVIKIILLAVVIFFLIKAMSIAVNRFFVPKKQEQLRIGIFLALIVGVRVWGYIMDNNLVQSVAQQSMLIAFAAFSIRGGLWGRLCAASMFGATLEFLQQIVSALLSIALLFTVRNQTKTLGVESNFVIWIITSMIAAVGISFLAYRMQVNGEVFTESCGKLIFFSVCFLLFLLDIMKFGISRGNTLVPDVNGDPMTHTISAHVVIVIFSFLSISLYMSLYLGLHRLMQDTALAEIKKTKIAYYEALLEQYKTQLGVQHDMKKHLIGLSGLAEKQEWEQLEECMRQLSEDVKMGRADIETGNIIANAVLNTKKMAAAKEKIRFECHVVLSTDMRLDEFELCIILSHLLDNAITAAKKIKEVKKRYIRVSGEMIRKDLQIEVENSVKKRTIRREFGPEDFGGSLQHVQEIVKRMNGRIEFAVGETTFLVSLKLPSPRRRIHLK